MVENQDDSVGRAGYQTSNRKSHFITNSFEAYSNYSGTLLAKRDSGRLQAAITEVFNFKDKEM